MNATVGKPMKISRKHFVFGKNPAGEFLKTGTMQEGVHF